jgi:hypothetical protein
LAPVTASSNAHQPKFNANNNNEVVNFISKVKAIIEACPDIAFSAILNAVKPTMSVTVNQTLANEAKDISTVAAFSKFLNEQYAASENINQKLGQWFSSNKKRGKPSTSHLTELQNNILAIRTGHEEFVKTSKANNVIKTYEPFDVWELIVYPRTGLRPVLISRVRNVIVQEAVKARSPS